jgi:hypothetical protein
MRRDDQPVRVDAGNTDFTFNFQISSSGGRQACSVKVQARNIHDATRFFRQNWPMIETMAREGLAAGVRESIRLDMPDAAALAADPA